MSKKFMKTELPKKSMMRRPSEARPEGLPKKVTPFGGGNGPKAADQLPVVFSRVDVDVGDGRVLEVMAEFVDSFFKLFVELLCHVVVILSHVHRIQTPRKLIFFGKFCRAHSQLFKLGKLFVKRQRTEAYTKHLSIALLNSCSAHCKVCTVCEIGSYGIKKCTQLPMKSMMRRPSETRPEGFPKKVIPFGGRTRAKAADELPVSEFESPKLKIAGMWQLLLED
nr:nitrate transporter [Ipomoea batatas]